MESSDYITIEQARDMIPGRPSAVTLWRWMRYGLRSRSGGTIRLTHVRFGARLFTTADAVNAFASELAAADAEHFQPASPAPASRQTKRTPERRQLDLASSRRRLKEIGIG